MTGTSDGSAGLRIRQAARALVLDPADRVLLVRFEFPDAGSRWALPGGGLEPGESHEDALRRELSEEVGLHDPTIGPHIWDRLHIIPFIDGRWDGQRERIHLVRSHAFDPVPALPWEALHAEYMFEVRWWHLDDIPDDLDVVPRSLRAHLAALLRDGPPNRPVDVGV